MSTTDRWSEVRQLFHELAELPEPARDAYLAAATVSDDVRDEVRSLLQWHSGDSGFLETPVAPAGAPSLVGTVLGPWRITGVLGRGGMGVVYQAVRADAAFEREVALKVVAPAAPSAAVLERFQRERETLARLDHPSIARLLDGGATPSGQPYFVMELVQGVPVDEYCDEHRLSVGRRLGVFLAICRAVQYAHQNLIVHRDLKPANILVLPDGTPKLLDFGVAKLLWRDGAATDERSALASTLAFTPDYASPEQLAGEPVTAASDVYALGVLLHVLLAGVPPYRLAPGPRATLVASLTTTQTRPASHLARDAGGDVHARRRLPSPAALSRRLAGDLDAIIAKATARDPERRYQTVDALARDIERHREYRPVQARPWSAAYVSRRFAERHAISIAMVLAALLVAAGGVGIVVQQATLARQAGARAEQRFDQLRALTRVFMFDVHDAIVNVPGTTDARALMVRTGVQYLQQLAADAGHDPSLRRELAASFVKMGDAQGHPTSPNIGDSAGARESYLRGIALAEALVRSDPRDLDAARTLALAHRRLADVLAWMGDRADALGHAETSARQFAAIAAHAARAPEDDLQAAIAHIKLGDLLGNPNFPNLGRTEPALRHYGEALRVLAPVASDARADQRARRYLGIVYERLGTMHQLAERWTESGEAYRASFEIRQALAAREPLHGDIQRDLAIAYEKLAAVERSAGRLVPAVEHARGALARFEQLSQTDPGNAIAVRSVAISEEHLADLLQERGDRGEARAFYRRAFDRHRGLAARDPGNAQAPCDAARVGRRLADAARGNGLMGDACRLWRDSERLRRQSSACSTSAAAASAPAAWTAACR